MQGLLMEKFWDEINEDEKTNCPFK